MDRSHLVSNSRKNIHNVLHILSRIVDDELQFSNIREDSLEFDSSCMKQATGI